MRLAIAYYIFSNVHNKRNNQRKRVNIYVY